MFLLLLWFCLIALTKSTKITPIHSAAIDPVCTFAGFNLEFVAQFPKKPNKPLLLCSQVLLWLEQRGGRVTCANSECTTDGYN